uniref:Uncharacterized protein n=1 Tax=Plectus sambesii TaxID=2011161 RepID=A0A914WA75_9BILA
MIRFAKLALLLCGFSFFLECSADCSITKDTSSKKSSLHLLWGGTPGTGGLVHLLSTAEKSEPTLTLESTLSEPSIYEPDSDCPAECLIELTPMEFRLSNLNHSITMARPWEFEYYHLLGFQRRVIPAGAQKIYCASKRDCCGATVNLYRYVSFLYNDYFVTTAIMQKDHYGLDNMGIPLCYVWDGSNNSSSIKDKLKWAGILLGVAIATLLIAGLIALITVWFIKSGSTGSKVDGLYQGDSADSPPRPVETQETQEPVHHEPKKQPNPQQKKHFDISDPRGEFPDAYID